ncbi:MAG TPA: glutamine--fructose-6-phosphate transaminase (isomerizing), partial [Desulfobacteraceae bacterium]|nr:glutamine--fructose-6-phosphate transaminase (isomerizing) [Desulfobacteraceae bacterium]
MCGIVGYTGIRKVVPVLLEGLRRLEYRGYDSAGLVYSYQERLVKYRAEGKLANLESVVDENIGVSSHTGLGHTRWATHGEPTMANAHPHSDCTGELVVVHNGIIENYGLLKEELLAAGHRFASETDTEVLAHLIEHYLEDDLAAAVRLTLARVEGSYALGVLWSRQPGTLIAARNHSPLVLGIDDDACYMASDVPALLPYTRQVIFLDDREMAVLNPGTYEIMSIDGGPCFEKEVRTIDWNAAMAEKAGFKHFMLKEIFEQPRAILDTVSGRIVPDTGEITLPEIGLDDAAVNRIERISLVACGTSWHAALVARYWIEKWVGIPVEVDIASEFRYRTLLLNDRVLTIAISQSGETADTLAGTRLAAELGSRVITICNVVGSTMTREADGVIYTHAGPEIGVASTKAFTSQLTALFLLTLYLGKIRGTLAPGTLLELGSALVNIAGVIERELP